MQFEPYTYIQTKVRERKLKISLRGITVKNHQTTTKFKLDLRNPMTYPYIKFELNVCNTYRDNERKLKISIFFLFKRDNSVKNLINASKQKLESGNWKYQFFSKFKRDNSVKNQWTITKFELDLRIPMMNLHMQFEPYTYIQTKFRERKLKFFSRGITLSKNHPTMTKFELDLHNPMMYPYTKFE
jgi:hypothetical protein